MNADGGHSYTVSNNDDDDDPVEKAVKNTGCYDKHVQLQECMFNHRDWRVCQKEVKLFKQCMNEHQASKESSSKQSR